MITGHSRLRRTGAMLVILGLVWSAHGQTPSQENTERMIKAIEKRDVPAAFAFLASGVDLNAQDSLGRTALTVAIAKGLSGLARRLVVVGADPNFPDDYGGTPLMQAAWTCNLDMAEFLVDHGARLDPADRDGETALMQAAWFCHDGQMVRFLLNAGAGVNLKSKSGTALTAAAFNGDEEAVRALVAAGADLNATDSEGETALAIAKNRVIGRKKSHDRIYAFLLQAAEKAARSHS